MFHNGQGPNFSTPRTIKPSNEELGRFPQATEIRLAHQYSFQELVQMHIRNDDLNPAVIHHFKNLKLGVLGHR